jgi:hypothetical protein
MGLGALPIPHWAGANKEILGNQNIKSTQTLNLSHPKTTKKNDNTYTPQA